MRKLIAAAVMFATAGLFVPAIARAHFNLMAPPSWANQAGNGDPQKSAPCGQADQNMPAVPTNMVTAFATGATVTVTLRETIPHPGHYRVALSTTGQSGLPADPPVTGLGSSEEPAFGSLESGILPVNFCASTGLWTIWGLY